MAKALQHTRPAASMALSKLGAMATLTIAAFALAPKAGAQNMSGVFGPVIEVGSKAVEYRAGYDPDSDQILHRVHVQQALSGDLMWRLVAQSRQTSDGNTELDFLGSQLFVQLTPDGRDWQSGLRLDVRLRDAGRPHALRLDWSNELTLTERWRVRGVILAGADFGDAARDGLFLQTRGQLAYKLPQRRSAGLEVFSAYGSTSDFPELEAQIHQIGPYYVLPVSPRMSITAGALFGLTSASPATNLKLAFTRTF